MNESKSNQNAAAPSKSTTPLNIGQRRKHMVQNYLLIWVDASIDQTNKDCQNTLAQLKNVVNDVNLCTESDQCIQVLNEVDKEQVFVIISGPLSQHLVPEIHGIPQLDEIYILCDNKSKHQEWTQNWAKVKGVHTNIDEICQALQLAIKQCDQDTIAVSFLAEILLDIKYDRKVIKDLAACCREIFNGNPTELQLIDEFERDYRPKRAIWWYTRECFTYKMLNQALRTMDADIIINMGFFLSDIHQQIQRLYEQQVSSYGGNSFVVYRGQGLMKPDFEKLQKVEGGLMSFNSFLSTSKNKKVSFEFAVRASLKPDTVGILFIMPIDPYIKSTPFASITELSYSEVQEEEILFSMHTVFRVNAIKQIGNKNQLYQVELQLTSDQDQQLRLLTDRIREEAGGSTGWHRLGNLLLVIGQFNKAEELYNLAYVKNEQGDYGKAIWYHEKVLEIRQKTLPSNHILLATSYNKIGNVYNNMREYSKALSSYAEALEIFKNTLPSIHPLLATSYNNIGIVYEKMGENSKAPSFYEKALEIKEKTLPSNHPSLAMSYNNMVIVYTNIGEYSKALSYCEKSLEIKEKTLPPNHSDLATSYNNIFSVYNSMGEYSKALSVCKKALEIEEKTLPPNHSDLATSYNNIGFLYNKMGEYPKALSFLEKALEIQQKTLPSNHPDLAASYNNIGRLYDNMGEYSKALSSHEKALTIWQKTLPSNHPSLATSYSNIGLVYDQLGEYWKALSFYEEALEIYQRTLPSDHPDLATLYNNIGTVYFNMGDYSKALSFHKQGLEIQQKSLPSNHPDFAQSYNNIGFVYKNMKDYSKALSYYECALNILQRALPPTHPHIKIVNESIEVVKNKL
ncbi:unnamed protein product [Adineta steineri]|uniref:NAD(P)(+)--arginine ADP-ribosyltransferase n=2 Tax=Adineta steineri TaxID=433720 RepID=A0A818X2T9_9BILA|nr:unnamed protein product [Adineta steineri]